MVLSSWCVSSLLEATATLLQQAYTLLAAQTSIRYMRDSDSSGLHSTFVRAESLAFWYEGLTSLVISNTAHIAVLAAHLLITVLC